MAKRSETAVAMTATRGRPQPILVVMGVSGSGKTTVGKALAARLGWP